MPIGAPWEVLDWERIAGIYKASTQKANGVDSTHLSKKSGMITLTPSWDEMMSAP